MWVSDDLSEHATISKRVHYHYLADSEPTGVIRRRKSTRYIHAKIPPIQGTVVMTCASGSKEMWVSDDLSEHANISRRVHSHYLADSGKTGPSKKNKAGPTYRQKHPLHRVQP
jgi:hypothetical protein